MDADVLIIGAGPAGSVAARMLKKLGHNVVILEKEQFPRFSIGESLLPYCMELLEAADLLEVVAAERFQLKNGAAFSHAGKLTEFNFSQKFSPGWATTYQVPRARFDQVLAEAAVDCGVPIHYRHSIVAADFGTPGQARLTELSVLGGLQRAGHTCAPSTAIEFAMAFNVQPRVRSQAVAWESTKGIRNEEASTRNQRP